jgi:hypothetical protein
MDPQEATVIDGIEDDLIQLTEIGDGSREYELVDNARLYVNYYTDRVDADGAPIVEGRYRVIITLEKVQA